MAVLCEFRSKEECRKGILQGLVVIFLYLALFGKEKGKKKDRSILCFVNVLMDKCRTIQRESAVGDRGLKGSNNFFLALC